MPCTLQVVAGPTRSGKTTLVADRYAEQLALGMARGAFGPGLWLAPNRFAAEHVRKLLLARLPGGCLAPQVQTFEGFSDQILRLAPLPIRPLSRLQARHLLRQIVRRLAGAGRLSYLASLADSKGLLDTLCAQISELKRLEIWPDEFEAACSGSAANPKDQDLARIYRAYQQVLHEHHLYDAEGRFWSARTLLREGHRELIRSVKLVVADGFTDFMPPQHEMLQVLADVADEVWITLPMDDALAKGHSAADHGIDSEMNNAGPPPREDLFSKTLSTLAELKRRHRNVLIHPTSGARKGEGPPQRVFEDLFRPPCSGEQQVEAAAGSDASPSRVSRRPRPSIAVWEMVSPLHEIRGVARDIKAKCSAGELCLDDVVVVFRSLSESAAVVEEAFAEYGVPVYIECRKPLQSSPLVRSLLAILQLDHGDWQYDDLLAVIRNRRIRWPALANLADSPGGVRTAAERIVRGLQIPSGRDALLRQVERLASDSTNEGTRTGAGDAARSLSALATCLDELPRAATPAEWAAEMPRLLELCGGADERTRTRLIEALHQVQRLEEQVHGRATTLTRCEALDLLTDIAAHETLPQSAETTGRVRVVSAISARGIEADHVYFVGLDERAMPRDTTRQAYYCDREVGRLIGAGLPLVSATRRYEEEMLLFYEVASRAGRRLVLSYPALEEKAQAMLPSPFLVEVQRVGGEDVEVHRQLELRPVDREAAPLSPREFRTRAVCDAIVDGSKAERWQRLFANDGRGEPAGAVLDGLRIVAARAERDAFGPAEGVFTSEAVARALAVRFGPGHRWSPTALEGYALCPFRFLLERVLEIVPLDDLELSTDYRRRGSLAHQCLLELYQQFSQLDAALAVSAHVDEEAFRRHVLAFVKKISDLSAGGGFRHALGALDLAQVAEMAELLYEQQKCYDGRAEDLDSPPRPCHFEVRFGPPREGAESDGEDPLSTDEAFVLDLGDEKVLLTGRIDRIDVGILGQQKVFNIIDYKTGAGKALKPDDVRNGLQLQIPLYALVVEELLLAEHGAVAWQADYWWVKEHGFGNKRERARTGPFALRQVQDGALVESADWTDLKADLLARIREMIRNIRDGKFVVYSQDPDCTRNCPYDGVCRIGHVRSLEKTWPDACGAK